MHGLLLYCCWCMIFIATWPPVCPPSSSPCFQNGQVFFEFNVLFQGLSCLLTTNRLQNYLQACRTQVHQSLRQAQEPLMQEQDVSVRTSMLTPVSKLLCASFQDFLPLSAAFCDFSHSSLAQDWFPAIFCKIGANFLDLPQIVHCMGVDALCHGARVALWQRTASKV